MHQVKSICH